MRDNDSESGSEQQGSWKPPEYVSPWIPTSGADNANDTISFGPHGVEEPGGDPGQGITPGQPGAEQGYGLPGYPQPGYTQPGYTQPGFGQSGYTQPGFGQPGGYGQPPQGGYGAWSGGQAPWGYGPPPPPQGPRVGRVLAYVAVAVLAAGAGAGAAVALNHSSSSASASSPQNLSPQSGQGGGEGGQFGNGFVPGGAGNNGGGTNSGSGTLNAQALASRVDPGIVDVTSQLKYANATAEGTGMVISSNGLVLTNNHVINQATSVTATLVVSGRTYPARVIGYDSTDDVALLQLQGASGLKTVALGNSSQIKVGDAVLALGNAGGRGGLPSTAQGVISGLNRTIQASDQGADTSETLHGMLQTNAGIQEGDSGGPLVNSSAEVIGMDTAANASGLGPSVNTTGFAIPINRAVSIATQIAKGHASGTVHIGLAGFLGVNVADANRPSRCVSNGIGGGFGNYTPPVSSGALICFVNPGTPAAAANLNSGDVITEVDGHAVSSANSLTSLMAGDHPGDQLSVVYVDSNGGKHDTTITLSAMAR